MNSIRHAYLRLSLLVGIGPYMAGRLIQGCGSVEAVAGASSAQLLGIDGVGPKLLKNIQTNIDAEVDAVQALCLQHNIQYLCPDDDLYPAQLAVLDDAPLILYVLGDADVLSESQMLAVVGARRCSQSSKVITRRWCRYLAERQVCICSGMAYGIDGAAHGGALDAKKPTIAVLGCGLATLNPEQIRQAQAIIRFGGCVVSEYVPDAGARPEFFPRRNRIIAGLAAATLVTEADVRSGSLITARQAVGYGREVFAVPGSVLDAKHKGCHQLLRDGAFLIEDAQDIVGVMQWKEGGEHASKYEPSSDVEANILALLAHEICHVDYLLQDCNLTLPELSPTLLTLELLGVIHVLPGNRYTLS
ncbi:MAG: DNA-processing protein DprA [Mariprofundaceae bacterium]|nr:DNA-processing protein DprA [Mariprofundaceae bacterium]